MLRLTVGLFWLGELTSEKQKNIVSSPVELFLYAEVTDLCVFCTS